MKNMFSAYQRILHEKTDAHSPDFQRKKIPITKFLCLVPAASHE
jgi:hypothetical protein